MQNGPRYLTDGDIHDVLLTSNLLAGQAVGQTGTGYTASDLGQIGQTGNGRLYRLVTVGGTSTVAPGSLLVQTSQGTNSTGLAISSSQPANTATGSGPTGTSALSKGSRSFNVTNGATAVTIDEFKGGYVEVIQTSGTSEGPISYLLSGNSAASAMGTITLELAEPLANAEVLVAGTDTVNLVKNPYANVVTSATAAIPVGVLVTQVPNTSANTYAAWVQVKGECLVQADATGTVINETFKQSTTTAGAIVVTAAATDNSLGVAKTTTTSAPASVNLDIV
jgi:hypothetical protein